MSDTTETAQPAEKKPSAANIGCGFLLFVLFMLVPFGAVMTMSLAYKAQFRNMAYAQMPRATIDASVPGFVHLAGTVQPQAELLSSPHTNTPCIYYRYLVEEYEDDSWSVVSDTADVVRFTLTDETGTVLAQPRGGDFEIQRDWQQENGSYRYTEFRLHPGDTVALFGNLDDTGAGRLVHLEEAGANDEIDGLVTDAVTSSAAKDRLAETIALFVLSMALFGLFCAILGSMLSWNRVLPYVVFLMVSQTLIILIAGTFMVKKELSVTHTRVTSHLESADTVVQELAATAGVDFSGDWSALGDLTAHASADSDEVLRIRRIRAQLAVEVETYEELRGGFSERIIASLFGIPPIDPIDVPQVDIDELGSDGASITPPKVATHATIIGLIIAIPLGFFLLRLALKNARVQRFIANLPTVKVGGVVYGLIEVTGRAKPSERGFVEAPLTREHCVYYRYQIKKKADKSWKTLEDHIIYQPFNLTDETGSVLVDPLSAEVVCKHHHSYIGTDKLKYVEQRVMPGDELYVLGKADVDPHTGSRLSIRFDKDDADDLPYIITTKTEKEVLGNKADWTRFLLVPTVTAGVLAGVLLFGSIGPFTPSDLLVAACVPLVLLVVIGVVLIQNDFVFLKHRVNRAWANIDVALKKRADLVPNLVKVVKEYAAHEKELLADLRRLRELGARERHTQQEAQAMEVTEEQVRERFVALFESYPQLKADQLMQQLFDQLVRIENEIALMREGYNHYVTEYNTKRQHFPEVLLAKLLRYGAHNLFRDESA